MKTYTRRNQTKLIFCVNYNQSRFKVKKVVSHSLNYGYDYFIQPLWSALVLRLQAPEQKFQVDSQVLQQPCPLLLAAVLTIAVALTIAAVLTIAVLTTVAVDSVEHTIVLLVHHGH